MEIQAKVQLSRGHVGKPGDPEHKGEEQQSFQRKTEIAR